MIWKHNEGYLAFYLNNGKKYHTSSEPYIKKSYATSQTDFDHCHKISTKYWVCVGPTVLHRWIK